MALTTNRGRAAQSLAHEKEKDMDFPNVRCANLATCKGRAEHKVMISYGIWRNLCAACTGQEINRGNCVVWLAGVPKPSYEKVWGFFHVLELEDRKA